MTVEIPFKTLREFIDLLARQGEVENVDGAHWDLEIGALTELMWESDGPALLFDNIPGYPRGHRVITNLFGNKKRCLLTLNMPLDFSDEEAIEEFEGRMAKYKPVPPQRVTTGPVMENVVEKNELNLFKFPTPKWHELDGGRYIGTGCCVIQRDPESGWINVGTYRAMIHDERTTGISIAGRHHGGIIERKYWEKGASCPVAVSIGPEPILFLASSGVFGAQWGVSEYDVAGYVGGAPIEVLIDDSTHLPIPANSEVVFVGEIPPPQVEMRPEGPFGEYTGYYAHGQLPEPVVRVRAIYHRDEPILLGCPALMRRGSLNPNFAMTLKKRDLKRRLLAAGIPDVLDDCTLQDPGVEVVKIKQRYAGHAAEVGFAAAALSPARIVIIVDEDIDIRDPWQVLWAIGTRCDPETSVEVARGCSSSTLDPRMPPERKAKGDLTASRLVINACRPYHWAKEFPPVNRCSKELRTRTLEKWNRLFQNRSVKP